MSQKEIIMRSESGFHWMYAANIVLYIGNTQAAVQSPSFCIWMVPGTIED